MQVKLSLDEMQAEMRARVAAPASETLPEILPAAPESALPYSQDWETFLTEQIPGTRPDVEVYVLRHKQSCKGKKKYGDERCVCPKWAYVKRERNRFSLLTNDWKSAEVRVEQYCDSRDLTQVRERQRAAEWDSIHSYKRMRIADGVALMIKAKLTGKVSIQGRDIATGKIQTYASHLQKFLEKYNAQHPQTLPIEHFDQITTELLQDHWRPTWNTNTFNSMTNQRNTVIHMFHYAMEQHWLPDTRKMGLDGACECMVCKLHPVKGVALTQPKLPFDMPNDAHRMDSFWQTRYILEACKKFSSEARPQIGERLAALIQVGLWSGARIIDCVLMARSAVNLATGMWSFQPLKTKNTTGKTVITQLPPHICQILRQLPAAADSHRDYFFWTGASLPQNGADPWHRDLADLWSLVDKRAGLHQYRNEEGHQTWGMRDPARGNRWSKVSFHSFRNTFAVRCRIQGMSFTRIAELLGDSEATVKEHYSPYTEGVRDAVTADLRLTWPQAQHDEIAPRRGEYVVSTDARASA